MRLRRTSPRLQPDREQPADRVTRQLLEALLFERLIPFQCGSGRRNHWQILHFRLGNLHCHCRGKIRGFGRIRLDIASLVANDGKRRLTPALSQLIAQLPCAPESRSTLLRELRQTVNFCLWNQHNLPRARDRRAMNFDAIDAALDEGHPYHPCFKARTGFTLADHQNYGPETGSRFRLRWLAVDRHCAVTALPDEEQTFWLNELGHEQAFLLRAAFNRTGTDWDRFTAMPIHPWQWQHLREQQLASALATGQVRDLGPLGDQYRPGQSLRSLFNQSCPARATLKLPLAVGNTSAVRTLEAHSVPSAPAISQWLADTVGGDSRFAEHYRLELMPEYASSLFTGHPDIPGHLGCIWRESINEHLWPGEQALPMNALTAIEFDDAPLIAPWLADYGAQTWLNRLLEITVLPVWHLLVAHGIGVEAHAQNMVMIHRDGWPTGIALRDFHDSVEYVERFLPSANNQPDFGSRSTFYQNAADNRYYRMAAPECLRELVMDTLLVYNLSELANFWEEQFGLPEDRFWAQVRAILAGYRREHPELTARLQQLDTTAPTILTESLMTRKLRGPAAPECHHRIPNPLSERPARIKEEHHSPMYSVIA